MPERKIIVTLKDGERRIRVKNDGAPYWPLVKACIDLRLDQAAWIRNLPAKPDPVEVTAEGWGEGRIHPLIFSNPKRMVLRLDIGGRSFILKRARMGTVGLGRIFPWAVGLTYFTRVMAKATAAAEAGCRATQDYFLVAERPLGLFRQEVWALIEYIDGKQLQRRERKRITPSQRMHLRTPAERDAVRVVVTELLRHELTMDDVSPGNFIETPDGTLRAIDISCRPFTALQVAKMRRKIAARHDVFIPPETAAGKALDVVVRLRYWIRERLTGEPAD